MLSSELPVAAGVGGSARSLLSQGWPSLFDRLIARRGLADPGVTPVTTKVELEEIRLKERRKKKIKGGACRRLEAETEGRRSKLGSRFRLPPSSSFAQTRRDFALSPQTGRGLVTEASGKGMAAPLRLEKSPQLPLTPYYDPGVNFLLLTPRIIRPVKMGGIENNPRLALKSGRPSPGTETQTRRVVSRIFFYVANLGGSYFFFLVFVTPPFAPTSL